MKRRTIYLILLSVVTIAAICFGTWVHLGYLGYPELTLTKDSFSLGFQSPGTTTIVKRPGFFDSVSLQLDHTDLELYRGDDYSVTYQGPEKACPDFKVTNGILTATQPSVKGLHLRTSDETVIITIPKDVTKLKEISLSSDNGDLTVEPDQSLTLNTLKLKSSNGDLELSNCQGKTITASTDNGDISAEKLLFSDSDLASSNGDLTVSLADSLKNYSISVTAESGDVTIGDNSYSLGDGDHSSIRVGDGQQKMSLRSDNGDIDVEEDR